MVIDLLPATLLEYILPIKLGAIDWQLVIYATQANFNF